MWRLGIDAGFTCPHRSSDRRLGGCRFCSPDGNISAYQKNPGALPDIEQQIERALLFTQRRYRAKAFFLYFQAYTCTSASVEALVRVYTNAIDAFWNVFKKTNGVAGTAEATEATREGNLTKTPASGPLKGIIVSTRPDCFDKEKAELLASYARAGMEVWVEFGLQSAHARTLSIVGRHHSLDNFFTAMRVAREAHLRRAVHLMLGLPGESRAMMVETARVTASTIPEGVKFHDLRIVRGSAFARSFLSGELTQLHPSRLPGLLADCLEVLPPSAEIMRISADFRPEESINIHPPLDKHLLARLVEEELERRNSYQGQQFKVQ